MREPLKFFDLDAAQLAKLEVWTARQDAAALAEQRSMTGRDAFWIELNEDGEPYYGVSGGELTFEITPTGIGTVVKVRHNWTKKTLDLSEYEKW